MSEFPAWASPAPRSEQASVASIRVVEVTSEGMWRVRSPGARRASALLDTRGQAEARAREILRKCGGGEIRVYDTSGDPFSTGSQPRARCPAVGNSPASHADETLLHATMGDGSEPSRSRVRDLAL